MMQSLIFPQPPKKGDIVAVVAPSSLSKANRGELPEVLEGVRSLGYRVRAGESLYGSTAKGYAAAPAEVRARDLMHAFSDPEVRAVWALRGGSMAAEVLPLLDAGTIRRDPKPLIGFSDITSLHMFLQGRCGMVSFLGPVARGTLAATFADYDGPRLSAALEMEDGMAFVNAPGHVIRVLEEGTAEGILTGGNLTVFLSLLGTPYLPDVTGRILFLEDVGEDLYRIDRMLTQLKQSGILGRAAGILLGDFTRCPNGYEPSYGTDSLLRDFFAGFGKPVYAGLTAGHIPTNGTLPLGTVCRMENGHIRFFRRNGGAAF